MQYDKEHRGAEEMAGPVREDGKTDAMASAAVQPHERGGGAEHGAKEALSAHMRALIERLNEAAKAYYSGDRELMSNLEYDSLYDELERLERESGMTLSDSPTQRVGFEAVSELPKERHASPMLSLDKTKSLEDLQSWLGDAQGVLSWKLDGLTIVLSYREGRLEKAVTRGNGEIGEVITGNARAFRHLPLQIPFQGTLVLRGEALITYADFERINASLGADELKYKNPRNLCSGSVRQLDPRVTRERSVQLLAFALVSAIEPDGRVVDFGNSRAAQFDFLEAQGFCVVEHSLVNAENLQDCVRDYEARIGTVPFPSDGLVLSYEDLAYSEALGSTAKFPRHSMAFKWTDELAETVLREVEWSPSRTGLINPVAIFDSVELEGTTVSRASLHNLSVIEELGLGVGDRIQVYKANMIIPQVAAKVSGEGELEIPAHCPACGEATQQRRDRDALYLYCPNPDCPAKKLKNFVHFVSRDALNIEGLSEAGLEKLIAHGLLHSLADLFGLNAHAASIVRIEGFGAKSMEKLAAALKRASSTQLYRLVYGLGIPGVGLANAKALCRYFRDDLDALMAAGAEQLQAVDGIGAVLAAQIEQYFAADKHRAELERLRPLLHWEAAPTEAEGARPLEGLSVVITGSLTRYPNRKALEAEIERAGGRCASAVSSQTACLINNDLMSNSSKNKKAKVLGIPILSEADFVEILQGNKTLEAWKEGTE